MYAKKKKWKSIHRAAFTVITNDKSLLIILLSSDTKSSPILTNVLFYSGSCKALCTLRFSHSNVSLCQVLDKWERRLVNVSLSADLNLCVLNASDCNASRTWFLCASDPSVSDKSALLWGDRKQTQPTKPTVSHFSLNSIQLKWNEI